LRHDPAISVAKRATPAAFAASPDHTATAAPEHRPAGTSLAAFGATPAPRTPHLGPASQCVVGIGYQSQVGARSILWFYTEPRFRLHGKAARGRSNWEIGALFRLGLGSIERTSTTPVIFAPGAYLARQIRSSGGGASWSIQGSYSHAWYAGFPSDFANAGGPPHSDRLNLGLGWFQ
jgi:hypothetical protein